MLPEMKLVISHNDKVIQTVTREVYKQDFVKSLEDFQVTVNAALTKIIEDAGGAGDLINDEEVDDSENDDEDTCVSPKKKKK